MAARMPFSSTPNFAPAQSNFANPNLSPMQMHLPGKEFSLKSPGLLAMFLAHGLGSELGLLWPHLNSQHFIFMIRVLLLGLGRWGVNHLRNLHAMPIQLHVAEVDAKQLEPARKLGLPLA